MSYSKLTYCLLIIGIVFSSLLPSRAQNISNEGKDFWLVFPRHEPSNQILGTLRLFITSKSNTKGIVTIGSTTLPFTITANTITAVDIPRTPSYLSKEGYFSNRGIHISVESDQPKIVVYAHIFAHDRSAATLVLPVESLGSKYYVMGYDQHGLASGFFTYTIVATEPNTTVLVHQQINYAVSSTLTVTLTNAGDVYQFLGPNDYTGTYIESDPTSSTCKNFAVFTGSSAISIPFAVDGSLDPLFQQLYSTNQWGKNYAYVPSNGPNLGNIIRVLAQEDNTVIHIDGISSPVHLNKGEYYTSTPLSNEAMITADKLISVAQFALSEKYADSRNINLGPNYNGPFPVYSDPDMVILSPLEFNTRDITVYSPTLVNITKRFINVVIKTSASSTFKVNGALPVGSTFRPIGASEYSYIQLDVGFSGDSLSGIHLTADEGFNAIIYGFGDFESYAYAAGTNLATNIFLIATDHLQNKPLSTGCKNQSLDFKFTLPYIASELIWNLDDRLATPITQTNPPYTSIIKNGDTLYEYILPNHQFTSVGNKEIKISAKIPTLTPECTNEYKRFLFDFQIYENPEVEFSSITQTCTNDAILFSDMSNSSTSNILQWDWDFGDGSITSTRNPIHTYLTAGSYTVTLTVTAASGCVASMSKSLYILPSPIASFTHSAVHCQNSQVDFIDTSTSNTGVINQWFWNFGDGHTSTLQNPIHTFTTVGSYTISLIIGTNKDCKSATFTKNIVVFTSPDVDFELPKICLQDAIASFTNTTTIANNDTVLTYVWDFGDPNATVINPTTSTLKNPAHIYSTPGAYTVTLTVMSSDFCLATLARPLLVNGDSPYAAFNIPNTNELFCSEPISFEDMASINFGEITRIEWYYNFSNEPNTKFVDDHPNLRAFRPKQYTHQYPIFHTPLTQSYLVKMKVYSGNTCHDEILQTIILKAVPELIFDIIPNVCEDSNPFQLSAHAANSFEGEGTFSGKGVSTNGLFSPLIAGAGEHILTYTFRGSNGSVNTQTQTVIVYPRPTVNAGGNKEIFIGEQIQLAAIVQGEHLTYKWVPSTGLSRDDIMNPIASPKVNTTYKLIVTSSEGCSSIDEIMLTILFLPIPSTIFSPNGDGIDDYWIIKNTDAYPNMVVDIFDRQGLKVFHSIGYSTPWDGKRNHEDLPIDTYFYYIDAKSEKISPIFGSITILR